MALLETLPDEVANSLRELQSQRPAASPRLPESHPVTVADQPAASGSVATLERMADAVAATTNTEPDAEPIKTVAFETDMTENGVFGTEWLVVDSEQVMVFRRNGGNKAHLLHAVPLSRIKEAKAEMLIGNGVLNVRTDEATIPLVRYSQAVVGDANTIARRIGVLAKGDTPRESAVKEDKKHCPKCKRVLPEDSEVCPACTDKRAVMLRLFQFLAPYKLQSALAVVLVLSVSAVDLIPTYITGRLIDTLIEQTRTANKSMTALLLFIAALFVSRLLNTAFVYGQQRLNPWLGGKITMDIRMALYHKFNQLSLGYYDKRSTGSVMSRVTNDAENLWDFLAGGVPWFFSNIFTLVGIGFILLRLNWQLALLMLVPTPFIYLLTQWFMPRARRKYHSVWHRISKMHSTLNSTLTGMRVVKAFAQEDREVHRFEQRNQAVFEASYGANAFRATFWPVLGLLMSTGTYIIWIVGGYKVLNGVMTIGTLSMFNGYLMQFYQPFMNFSQVMDWTTRSFTAAERVFEVLDTEPDIADRKQPIAAPDIKGAVTFEDVSFTYDRAKRVLDDFTLDVKPGEMIGLVGHSGAGKSTIINLLCRFYDVSEGRILIDGVDIRDIKREDFRSQLGIVLQEPYLFPGTIRDNIAYAKPDATIDEILRAAKAANCHEFLLKFPDGYDTQVGERGQRLSGGERQRISIARAILHNPKILILDEATASVDTETEKQIQEAITRLVQNRTTFAIAHRLSTLRNASRLVVMKDGKMVESGTHEELMEQDGEYAKLVKIQTEVNKMKAI